MNINFIYLNEFGGGYEWQCYTRENKEEYIEEFLRHNARWGYTKAHYEKLDKNWDDWLLAEINKYDYVVAITTTKQTPFMEFKVKKLGLENNVFYRQQVPSYNINYPGEGRRLTTWVFAKVPKTLAPAVSQIKEQ